MSVEAILADLVAIPSVVGTPNGVIVDYVRARLASAGIASTVIAGPERDRYNLFATIGPASVPGYVLSAHLDVVPADAAGWSSDPFRLTRDGDRLVGRGATDMKGFVAAVLSAVPALARLSLERPIHIALSYDEEAGCRGVPHLIDKLPMLCAPPLGAIIGEPSAMRPVLAHKGKAALRLTARGKPGHSSRPDLGRNAIHALLPALAATVAAADEAASAGPFDGAFAPPYSTLQVGTVSGGEALNVIAGSASAEVEARAVPGISPEALLAGVLDVVAADAALTAEIIAQYPALSLDPDHELAGLVSALTGEAPVRAVSYGTEAGLFQAAGIPSIVCGPGDIDRAHKADEYITGDELSAAAAMVLALGAHLAGAGVAGAAARQGAPAAGGPRGI